MMRCLLLHLILLSCINGYGQQKLIIHVYERTEHVCFRKTTIDSTLNNPDIAYDLDTAHTRYEIDLGKLTSSYYVNDELLSVLPITLFKPSENLLKISIMEEGFDYGLLVQTDPFHENVTWFWFLDHQTTVKKISKFYIEKPS